MRAHLGVVAVGLALVTACGADTVTAPPVTPRPDLECRNAVVPPDRYSQPRRYADSIPLYDTVPGDRDYGLLLGWVISGYPVEDRYCLTFVDSVTFHTGKRS